MNALHLEGWTVLETDRTAAAYRIRASYDPRPDHCHIFNYFDHRYTNGYIEGLNGLLDEINRGGRGYDLETLRYKALLKYGDVKRLIDIYTYDLWKISPEEREEILGTSIGHGINLSTFERDLRAGAFW